ncbi:MAG TPA: nucleotidyltransferase family protein [Kiritimatiellia bacterium]|jgi:dTDP-glucose pyrophosphorylase
MTDLSTFCVKPSATLREVMTRLNRNQKGIVLVTDAGGQLAGTVTDGDIRRALLADRNLEAPVSELLKDKQGSNFAQPVTAPLGTAPDVLLSLLREKGILQVPLVDDQGRVAGLTTLDELVPDRALPLQAVIMAGGKGTRLKPLTENLPKPMLPVGGRPLMEHIIDQLRTSGVKRVSVATHFMPERITEHFGDGSGFGVELSYIEEQQPLGTAGALSLMAPSGEPMLVINGDILTQVDFRTMLAFHREHKADLTVAVRKYDVNVPYGVVRSDGVQVRDLAEKPVYQFLVNAGIYLLEPGSFAHVPKGRRFDMTDLIKSLIEAGRSVVSFPVLEYWLDVGQHGDYEQAKQDHENGRIGKREG